MCLGCRKKVVQRVKEPCMDMYNELVLLDVKVQEIYEETKTNELLLITKQLRNWMDNIQYGCPPDEDLNLIKQILNTYEHTIN